tara:strand:+ start:556 stop:864 length:309 start_codon:yes stop_codon:yes gene_type:complete
MSGTAFLANRQHYRRVQQGIALGDSLSVNDEVRRPKPKRWRQGTARAAKCRGGIWEEKPEKTTFTVSDAESSVNQYEMGSFGSDQNFFESKIEETFEIPNDL